MNEIANAAVILGKRGGECGTGKCKVRTKEQYRAMQKLSWEVRRLSISEKLTRFIKKSGPDDCWPWIGSTTTFGYGKIRINGKYKRSHRVAFEHHNKVVLNNGVEVCHKCDNPPCCNPAHLWLGTHAQNMADSKGKGRAKGGRPPGFRRLYKLSDENISEIRAMYPANKQKEIAQKFNIHQSTVSIIIHRKYTYR